jgi:hypothetical protein
MATTAPPWPAPVLHGGTAYVQAAGLPLLAREALQVHYHAHLDVIVDGQAVVVPAYIGFAVINGSTAGVTTLHTHDKSGVVHIESPNHARYTLGQFFTEWGVRFTEACLGPYCSGNGKTLTVSVNGAPYRGDPTKLVFHKHDEIAVEYGDSGKLPKPPSSYHFSAGL